MNHKTMKMPTKHKRKKLRKQKQNIEKTTTKPISMKVAIFGGV